MYPFDTLVAFLYILRVESVHQVLGVNERWGGIIDIWGMGIIAIVIVIHCNKESSTAIEYGIQRQTLN